MLNKCCKHIFIFTYLFALLYDRERYECSLQDLTGRLHEAHRQIESAQRELAELTTQLKMTEESRDSMKREALAAKRRIKEGMHS